MNKEKECSEFTSNNKQIKKEQHFVPKFYLKKFADSKAYIEVLDLKNRRLGKGRHYGCICYEEYFHGVNTGKYDKVSQKIEGYLESLENKLAPRYENFINKVKNNEQITDEDLYHISVLMSMLWVRSEFFREKINKINSDVFKKCQKIRVSQPNFEKDLKEKFKKNGKEEKILEKDIQKYKEILLRGNYNLRFSNKEHLIFIVEEILPFSNLFHAKNWRAYFAPKNCKFITADTPVIEWFPKTIKFWDTATFLERKHYLALTPEVIVELVNPISGKKFRRKRITEEEVFKFNAERADFSSKYCYGQRKEEFEKMIEFVSNKVIV